MADIDLSQIYFRAHQENEIDDPTSSPPAHGSPTDILDLAFVKYRAWQQNEIDD